MIIFIPIQHDIHCSLRVVINPGKTRNNATPYQHNIEIPNVLLFDSYRLHDTNDILKDG